MSVHGTSRLTLSAGDRGRPEKGAPDPMYGPAVRCKRFCRSWRCGLASMYPASDWSVAPGHHGYQRACDLISGQASNGLFGSPVFACAGKTDPPLSSQSSRRPRRVIQISNNSSTISLLRRVPLFVPGWPFLRPGLRVQRCAARKGRQGWPSRSPCHLHQCLQARLDGPEHGARIKQVGPKSH
jgi:hypothetical protein